MPVVVITKPTVQPVTLAEAKLWCRIDTADTRRDALVTQLIKAATEYAEAYTGRAFVQRTLEFRTGGFTDSVFLSTYGRGLRLPHPPLIDVTSVTYIDSAGATITVASSVWDIDTASEPGIVYLALNQYWPYAAYYSPDGVRVRYTAGYAPDAGSPPDYQQNVPSLLKVWLQQRVVTLYDQSSALVIGTIVQPIERDFVDGLLDSLIIGTRFG